MLQYVQGGVDQGNRFQNGMRTVLMAAPPRLEHVGGAAIVGATIGRNAMADQIAFPIGLVQNVNLGQNLSVARFYEIGSKRSYFVPGHAAPGLSFSRPHIHGMSLLRVAYAYYSDVLPPTIIPAVFANVGQATVPFPMNIVDPPGYENVFINLSSELFHNPVGFVLQQSDSRGQVMMMVYLECAYIGNHNWSSDAMGSVVQESCSVQFERIVPIATVGVALYNGR
jgi:hypothetical protein